MARGRTTFTTLALLLPAGALVMSAAGTAQAATPTYYNSLVGFQADVTFTVTDDYQNPGYLALQGNAAMNAVIGQTDYMTTGFLDWNIVSGGVYCAGCNGSFELQFQTTTVGTPAGVNGVGMNIQFNDPALPYFAYITFADGTTANIQLPAAGSFWGVAAPERIERIHFGLTMGGVTQAGGFGIDNLIVGDGNIGTCVVSGDCVDEGNPCTNQACVGGLCQYPFNTNPCDDGEVCTQMDVCALGLCQGSLVSCNDDDPCTTDNCELGSGCAALLNTDPCDDGDPCTEMDACSAGACGGSPVSCSDDDPCTVDSCDPMMGGCVSDPTPGCCFGDEDCGDDEYCEVGMCIPISTGSSDGGEETGRPADTGTPADTGVDDTGGSGGGSGVDTGLGLDSGTGSSSGVGDTGSGFDGSEKPDFSVCSCTSDPSPQQRLWWLLAGLGVLVRRRRLA